MEAVMATDFSHTWLPPSQSPCLDPNNRVSCWERCVKRKYNDGSGKLLRGYNMANTEDGNGSFSCDAMWCTMPSITHCHKTSITPTKRSSIASLQDKHRDKGHNPPLSVSNVGVYLHNLHLIVENETSYPLASADHPLQPHYIQNDKEDAVSKKRIPMAVSVETLHGAVQACDMATENELLRLKEALKVEKRALRKLYRDLEEERCASTTAADEAMAMIRRLQEEKAAALVESRQYKRVSEEREAYNQEAIALLKEALSIKEYELLSLQDHIDNYRSALRKMKSGQMIESNHLEGDKENAQLLLLEGKETASCSLVESKYLKGDLDEECDAGDRASGESMYWHDYPLEESFLEGQNYQENEIESMGFANLQCESNRSDTVIEEQDFEDVSMSILVRVARLEERLACLGQSQALDPDGLDPHNIPEDTSFLGYGMEDPASMLLENTELNCMKSPKLKTGFAVADNCEDLKDLKCPILERATTNSEYGNQDHGLSTPTEEMGFKLNNMKSRKYSIGLHKASDDQERSYSKIGDPSSEGVRDAYEVPRRLEGSAMPNLDRINGSYESGSEGRDFLHVDSMQVLENQMIDRATSVSGKLLPSYDDLEGCDDLKKDKLAPEISSAGGEAVESSVAVKDLWNLKERLQALEGERAFMKEAIEALRKENMELKLLQEIANRLQELQGSRRRDQLPFLSFFKGILSFAGIQSLASCTEKRRFFYGCQGRLQTSSNKQDHGGLLHLLNNSLREERSVCVTREHKVKLVNA